MAGYANKQDNETAKLYNTSWSAINPATEDKQDDIISNQTDWTQKTQNVDAAWNQTLNIDWITNALRTLDYTHHEIHSWSMYSICHSNASLASWSTINIYMKTWSVSDKWAHLVVATSWSWAYDIEILEGSTVTDDSWNQSIPIYNRNRNSANTSMMRDNAWTPNVWVVWTDVTISADWTVLCLQRLWSWRNIWWESRNLWEWILDEDTVYVIRLTSRWAANRVQIECEWYEHTNI